MQFTYTFLVGSAVRRPSQFHEREESESDAVANRV